MTNQEVFVKSPGSVVVVRIVSVVLRDAEMLTMIDGPARNGEIWRMS